MMNAKGIRRTWWLIGLFPVLICAIPFVFILVSTTSVSADQLSESFAFFSTDSIVNTILICSGVLMVSLFVGVGSAYLFAHYTFTGSRFFQIAFLFPIAIPGYIMAITYSSFLEYGGLFYEFTGIYIDPKNKIGLVMMLAACLYPYIYVGAFNAFSLNSGNYIESARTLGMSKRKVLFKIILPLALPAIIVGSWLVLMETINDFGASSYYGVRTISTEIIRCWQISPDVTILLSLAVMVVLVMVVFLFNRYQRKKGYYQSSKSKPIDKKRLNGWRGIVVAVGCSLFFILVFALPVAVLVNYSLHTETAESTRILLIRTYNSFVIAAIATVFILLASILAGYSKMVNRSIKASVWSFIADFGYVIPGAVLAIALVSVSAALDHAMGWALTGSLFFLILAYGIRFYTVGRQPIESLYQKLPLNLYHASVNLGQSPIKTFVRVYFPLLYPAFVTIFLLVFIDVLKELPVTLLLRPFNFETLSTSVYGYAKVNESVREAAPYSLLIITLGLLAVLLLKRIEKKYGVIKT